MLQQDYLMRMFTALAIAMRESMLRAQGDEDPEGAAELLEAALDKTTAHYLSEAGFHERATLRAGQAQALARAYGFELGPTDITPEELDRFFEEQNVDPSDVPDPSSLA